MTLPIAVCALIIRYDKAVVVSRRHDPNQWGLPGGKVDPGETPLQAIVREVREETGLVLDQTKLVELHRSVCPGDVDYDTITFQYQAVGPHEEDLEPEEGLRVAYASFEELCDETKTPFAGYNFEVCKKLFSAFVSNLQSQGEEK